MVAVLNLSKTNAITVALGSADAFTPPFGGGITFRGSGTQSTIGRWVHISVPIITVAAGQYVLIPLTVQVPSSTPPGEYTGVINTTDQQPIMVQRGRQRLYLRVTDRCSVTVRVSGQARAGLAILHAGLVAPYRQPLLAVTLHNTGTVIDHPVSTTVDFVGIHRSYTVHPRTGAVVASAATTVIWNLKTSIPPGKYAVRIGITFTANTVAGAMPQRLQATWSGTVNIGKG